MLFDTDSGSIIYKGGFNDGLYQGSGILYLYKNQYNYIGEFY